MQLYKTGKGNLLLFNGQVYQNNHDWDTLVNQDDLYAHLISLLPVSDRLTEKAFNETVEQYLLPPVGTQELWAAGVTYLRSRDARMEESQQSGGADFYQKVYEAERPELFFKAVPQRMVGHGSEVYIRKDSSWNVPEPELTLFINASGNIQAYTIGNDMSSRSIEGENPLYLPQAKSYEKSAAVGPCLYIPKLPISPETTIGINITRNDTLVFEGSVQINRMKRSLPELAGYLFRECDFAAGVLLMTGTGIVPPDDFTLSVGDVINITIDNIGTLTNTVAQKK
jgi:2-dehydro-3-deoxy-D-arabinonate dehydratase